MADISKCGNNECKLKDSCYRFTAIANELWQAYADFKPDKDGNCDYYWENETKNNENERK